MLIHLDKGLSTLIDDVDYEKIRHHKWRSLETKRKDGSSRFYARGRRYGSEYVLMHKLLMKSVGRLSQVDHINLNGLDNRRLNLRMCTPSQNMANRPGIKSLTGLRGLRPPGRIKSFQSCITVKHKYIHIGCFSTAIEADKAYDREALKHFGEFAILNFPHVIS